MDKNLLLQMLFDIVILLVGGSVLFYRSKKRKASADADRSEADAESMAIQNIQASAVEWKEIAEDRQSTILHQNQTIETKDTQITKLYTEKNEDRRELHRRDQEIATLKIELQAAKFRECNVRACINRNPPNELF